MSKRSNTAPEQPQAVQTKRPLKKLFEERDRTCPGSKEEEEATKKILESVFPDTNAD
jgi:hypothetical protein